MTEVRCEMFQGRIAIKWQRRFIGDNDMAKQVPNWKFHPGEGTGAYWSYPLTLASCRLLREVYTDMLVVGPELSRWARREMARTDQSATLAAAEDADLSRAHTVVPRLYEATSTRRYQRAGIKWLTDNPDSLLADEPTLGKTIQYLGYLAEAELDHGYHLIVAPKTSLYSTWANEVHKWTPWHAFWMPDGRERRERMLDLFLGDEFEGPKFLVVNFAMLQIQIKQWCKKCEIWGPTKDEERKRQKTGKPWFPMDHYTEAHKTKPEIAKQPWPHLFEIPWQTVCVDEAHLSLLGVRTGTVGEKNTQEGNGLLSLRMAEGGRKIASTGTPIHGHALNFWSVFHWLRPKVYSSKWGFADSFLEVEEGHFGKTIGDVRSDREKLLFEELRTIMLRRTKREVQPDLPEDVYIDHWVEMTDRHRKQYEEMVTEGEAEISGGSLSTKGTLDEYTRRKQFAYGLWQGSGNKLVPYSGESAKYAKLLRLLEERGVTGDPKTEFRLEGGWKYIVASQYTVIVEAIARELEDIGIATVLITGNVSSAGRNRAVTAWQEDPDGPRVMLMNTKAGGTSLTLDAMCDEMFILDETWIDDDQFQVGGRIRNRDVEKRVATRFFHYIRTRDTLEEEIAESGLSQHEFQKTILDRSRGVHIERRTIQK